MYFPAFLGENFDKIFTFVNQGAIHILKMGLRQFMQLLYKIFPNTTTKRFCSLPYITLHYCHAHMWEILGYRHILESTSMFDMHGAAFILNQILMQVL